MREFLYTKREWYERDGNVYAEDGGKIGSVWLTKRHIEIANEADIFCSQGWLNHRIENKDNIDREREIERGNAKLFTYAKEMYETIMHYLDDIEHENQERILEFYRSINKVIQRIQG